MGRKRPGLIPVVDDVLREALDIGDWDDTWKLFRGALSEPGMVEFIEGLRPDGLGLETTTLRLLDAALWMNISKSEAVAAAGGGPAACRPLDQ